MTHPDILDLSLAGIAEQCTAIHFCSQDPATYTEAATTYKLGSLASPVFSAIANGTGGRRSLPVTPYQLVTPTANGTATHVAFVVTGSSKLLKTQALEDVNGDPTSLAMVLNQQLAILNLKVNNREE